MNPFTYYNPVRILFGEGATEQIDRYIPQNATVLLTYGGGSIKKYGIYDEVITALGNRKVVPFGGIEPNPSTETLEKALPTIEAEKVDFILAVGGGSVIDGTKFIVAAAAYSGEDKWEMVRKNATRELKDPLPFGTVLTLSATGSEMNCNAVISHKATKEKLSIKSDALFPQFSVIDPKHTLSLPLKQVANGVVDSFVHVFEQYMTYPVNASIQDRFSEGILLTLLEVGQGVLEEPQNMELRNNLAMSAMMGLNGLIAVGVPEDWATHKIGHELTALFGLDHAVTLAIVLPALLRDQKENKKQKLIQCGQRVFNLHLDDPDQQAEATIGAVEDFFRRMVGRIRLSDYGITLDQTAPAWQRFAERDWHLGEHKNIDAQAVARILKLAL